MEETMQSKLSLRDRIKEQWKNLNGKLQEEKDKKKIKDAIESSASHVKIDLTDMADKKKKLIYSITKSDIDEETLDRLCEIIKNKEKEGK